MFNNEFRSAKRAHSPDGADNSFRGPPSFHRGGPPHHFHKRHRGEQHNQPQTIDDKIARLGETGSRTFDIGILAKEIDANLMNKVGEEERIKNITSKICRCIVSFPSRVSTYATLIGLISVKHYNVSCQIINTLHASYPVYLEAQKWQEALTIIHLLSSLVNCKVIRPSALLSQFELLLEITLEDNIPQTRSDYYVYTVLSSLPLVAQELSQQTEQNNFEQMLNTIETYLTKRDKSHLNSLRVWTSDDSTVQMDYLDSLWVQTKNFRANNWEESFLLRPYNEKEYKDIMASSLIPQNSPTIQIPAHYSHYQYPSPRIVLRLFEDDVVEGQRSIPGSDKIERFCVENHIRYLIDEIPNNTRDCARHISHIYRFDQLPMKHILIETLLGELLTLPKPKYGDILYHALLYELTKIFQSSQNPDEIKWNYDFILNEAVMVLYRNLNTMNITCYGRFIEWFSFHLNNTEYLFPWQSWSDATSKESHFLRQSFVREILDRCVRFSFHKKISTMVSGVLDDLMPAEVKVEKRPVFADNPKLPDMEATIDKLITERADAKTICETLNILIDGVELSPDFVLKDEKLGEKLMKIDVFTALILSKASKSLTHLSSAIGKYKNVFKALTQIDGGQAQLLNTIQNCLILHPQLHVILVDKLLKADLIEAREVCNWIFSDSTKTQIFRSFTWELLNNTIHRKICVIYRLTKEKQEKEQERTVVEEGKTDEEGGNGGDAGDAGDAGDVEMKSEPIVSIDDKISEATKACQDLILSVFERFASAIQENTQPGTDRKERFEMIFGQMQRVYYAHYEITQKCHDDLMMRLQGVPSVETIIVNLNR